MTDLIEKAAREIAMFDLRWIGGTYPIQKMFDNIEICQRIEPRRLRIPTEVDRQVAKIIENKAGEND